MTSSPPPPPLKDHLCSGSSGMDSRLWVSLLWVTLCTALAAPPAEMRSAGAPLRHVRNKRCSCASFLDKECVYFCHLDIIWVNTPERVVSYGLGNAPRAKRAVSMATTRAPRCRCVRESDGGCVSFCLRSQAAAGHARRLDAADSDRTGSTRTGHPVRPAALRSVLPVRLIRQTGLLLERRSARRRHRSRAWQSDSTPP